MVNALKEKIAAKTAIIGFIGMGYIGLSLLDAFGSAGYPLIGYDIDQKKIELLKKKKPYLNFLDHKNLFALMDQKRFKISNDSVVLQEADIIIISVATPLDRYRTPNLTNLRNAFLTISKHLQKNQLIILQSSTFPGTTNEELLPLLEKSGFKIGKDFFLAHVPEVTDIGNPEFSVAAVPKIISGITTACRTLATSLYKQLGCKTVACSSTSIAEAAKLLQNSFRLINISFINEMKILFDHMGLDVWEVIEAASSKPFGFMPFYPGPGVGGSCIPIVPFYLVWKAKATGGQAVMLEQAGHINDLMPTYVFNKMIQGLNLQSKTLNGAKVLVLGVTYKKDVNDLRESPALKLLPLLKNMNAEVFYHDPYVKELSQIEECPGLALKSIELNYEMLALYDAVIILTDHTCYDWDKIVLHSHLVVDTRNVTANVKAKSKIVKA